MTNSDMFSFAKNIFPSTIGFDSAFKALEDVTRSAMKATGYPPYNIKKIDENKYILELAVAGFSKQDIELELQDGVLKINGKTQSDNDAENYLYKGIADRAFSRQFTLADQVEIKNAELINGMLKIWLDYIIPESKKPRKININSDTE